MDSQRQLNFDIEESEIVADGEVQDATLDENYLSDEDEVQDEDEVDENATIDPCVGMEFESLESTYSFYNDYAKFVGFGIRKRYVRRSRINNEIIGRTYVCCKEGQKHTIGNVENPRPNTRVDCKAMMRVKRDKNGKWIVDKIVKEHNHNLEPQSSRFFRSHRRIKTPIKNVMTTLKSAGVQVPKIMNTVAKQSGGVKNVGFTEKDCRNFFDKGKRELLEAGDAQVIYEFFMNEQFKDHRFFHVMELDKGRHLRNVFWIDQRSRMAYTHFGDVITFDTTYLTNKYAMKFAPFVGVNNHGQSVLLGCALLSDETTASFVWVFRTWLAAMEGKAPRAIITDQDLAIKAAIKEVFPETCHRFCLWHIMRKIPEKLGSVCKADPKFMYRFNKCIYDSLTIEEFESRWKRLIEIYALEKHEWLTDMYECRKQWIPVFLKDTFFAGMSTSQRSESMNSFFDDYVDQKSCLKDFVDQYGLALNKRYNDEEKADFDSRQNTPPLKTTSPYEAQMASIYTQGIFKKFQVEVLRIPSCYGGSVRLEGGNQVHTVRELIMKPNGNKATKEYTVTWDGSKCTVSCICRLFEFQGFLCRHAMVVLFAAGVYEIPPSYILKRWTKDAKVTDVFDEACGEVREDGPEYIAKCFSDLSVDCMKVAEKGSMSKEKYKAAKKILKDALEMLSSIDLKDDCPSNQNIGNRSQTISTLQNVVIRDPEVSKSKGRKRIKSGPEMSNTKSKPYQCSHCKETGHNILKCKKKLEEDANRVQELNAGSNLIGNLQQKVSSHYFSRKKYF
ncbi:hypothetical protein ACHQM5_021868 [Ranunculus cassubicifolius]